MSGTRARPISVATLVAGTLDILAAATMALINGRPVDGMLRAVASGPFPGASEWGLGGAALGLAVHFALMAIMAAVYVFAARRLPPLRRAPILWGVLYGVATYIVMNLIVVPLRFGGGLPSTVGAILPQLSFHIFLVGIPIALIAARRGNR